MSNIKNEILFGNAGLDTDRDYRYVDNGDAPYRLNILIAEDGSNGVITNIRGNKEVVYTPPANHPWLNANVYFVLGSCYDELTRDVYYWVFSQPVDVTGSDDYEYDNRLLRFNEDTEIIDTIFVDNKNYFGLNPLYSLRDPFVLGNWLYFNPRTSEPKMIHIQMAYNYTNNDAYDETETYVYGDVVTHFGGLFMATEAVASGETPVTDSDKWLRTGDSYQYASDIENTTFDSEFRYAFFVIKHIPIFRPVCTYASDPDKNANNVRGKLFRFSHRYKYFDNSYSRYSAFSDITLPQYAENYDGEVPEDLDAYNRIDVTIRLHSPALIKEVDIIFQETGGDWKRAKIINRKDISLLNETAYTYQFYNTDSAYEVIDDEYFNEPYDAVPRTAFAQELINKNILCYANCKEGFTNIDKNEIDVLLTPALEAIAIPQGMAVGGLRRDLVVNNDITSVYSSDYGENEVILTTIDFSDWYPNGLIAGDILKVTLNGIQRTYTIQPADVGSILTFSEAIADFLQTNYPNVPLDGETWNYGTGEVTVNNFISVTEFIFYALSGTAETSLIKRRGFKTGAWHPFCIFYYDAAMRRWDAQTSKELEEGVAAWSIDGTTVYVPMLNEVSPTPLTTANKWNINWEVNHTPPAGSKWWRWGYAGNALCSKFVQYIIEEIEDPASTTWTRMNIRPRQILKFAKDQEATWNEFPQSIIDPYQWQQGDRVRFITEQSAANELGPVVDGVYDFEILKYDDSTPNEYWIYTQNFNYAGAGIEADSLIEIYTPIKSETSKIFYEFGEIMPIITESDGTLVHGCGSFGTQNQDSATGDPATGVFESGDVYHILRTPSKIIDAGNPYEGYFHESQWYSDFYNSDDWDKGRVGIETSFGERTLKLIRYSNQYLQNTLINGLPTFFGDKYVELNDIFGDIIRIIEIGDTLKVYQRKKPSSIPIGRTQYFDAQGNANVEVQSDRVFGAVNYSRTNYGTEYPESISKNNRYVYGFDVYNGVLWRDSANGIFPISGRYESAEGGSDYRMETYFKQKAKDLLVSGTNHTSVLTVWDERFHNLYVIFKDAVNEDNDEAIMFHEASNRWICFTDMDQTLEDGWDQILELDYWILWGFEGGIGYSFDEDTRFAVFNIGSGAGTTPATRAFPFYTSLSMTANDPTIQAGGGGSPASRSLSMTPYSPTVSITYVTADVIDFSWPAEEYGDTYGGEATFDIPIGVATMTAKPSWLTIKNSGGSTLTVGSEIYDTEVLTLYPTLENFGSALNGALTFEDALGNTCDFNVDHASALGAVTVVFVDGGEYGLSNEFYTCSVGSAQLFVSFDHAATINSWELIGVTDASLNVLYVGTGYPSGIWLYTGATSSKTMTLSRPLISGDVLTVQIGESLV